MRDALLQCSVVVRASVGTAIMVCLSAVYEERLQGPRPQRGRERRPARSAAAPPLLSGLL